MPSIIMNHYFVEHIFIRGNFSKYFLDYRSDIVMVYVFSHLPYVTYEITLNISSRKMYPKLLICTVFYGHSVSKTKIFVLCISLTITTIMIDWLMSHYWEFTCHVYDE